VDHGADLGCDRVRDDRLERVQEVPAALGGVILAVPDVGIARVDHPCHGRG